MKKLISILGICILSCGLTGCSSRYTFTQESFTADEKIESIEIDELDTTIIIEFSDEFEHLTVHYRESKEVDEIRYDIRSEDGHLKIKKKDSTNGFAIHLSPSNIEEEIPELRIKAPTAYMESIDISASDCSVKIIGGEIGNLLIKTSYYPIELSHTSVNSFTGTTKNASIIASIQGAPEDFTVRSSAKNGKNNLVDHAYSGQKQLDLETKDGDIKVTFEMK